MTNDEILNCESEAKELGIKVPLWIEQDINPNGMINKQEQAADHLEDLSSRLSEWQSDQGLPAQCALEQQMTHDGLSSDQREWLQNFCEEWDETQAIADGDPCPIHRQPPERCPDTCDQGANITSMID